MVFGCPPSIGVPAETKMMQAIAETLIDGCGPDMTVTFPEVLNSLEGPDSNIELVTSSTLRPLRLFYSRNIIR